MNHFRNLHACSAGRSTALHRVMAALLVAASAAVLAACNRGPDTSGDSPQVADAKGAVAHRLGTMETPEFRQIIEYRDGVVCGEFESHKLLSAATRGFRRFIYNAPEPGVLAIDEGNFSPQDVDYWCSDQPDKRLRMLAASLAELAQACTAARGKDSDPSCRLAAEQKRALDELRAKSGAPAGSGPAPALSAASPGGAQLPASAAAAPPVPASSSAGEAAILGEVQAALESWRRSWQDGDVEGYLRMYEDSFSGGAGSHARWAQQRRLKMQEARPSIGIENLRPVRITPQEVELRFVQVYAARQHRDTGDKALVFRRSPRGWLIAEERWKERK